MTDPISNANRIAMLLRQRLLDRARTDAARRSGASAEAAPRMGVEAGRIAAAAALEGADERRLRRAVIERILADHLGAGLLNDAPFQQIVEQVTEILEGDAAGSSLLAGVLDELRSAAS